MSEAILPLPQYASMTWCSAKVQGQVYLLPGGLYLFCFSIMISLLKELDVCISVCLTSLTSSVQNTVGICRKITVLIFKYVSLCNLY
jgi:hypothetical protein